MKSDKNVGHFDKRLGFLREKRQILWSLELGPKSLDDILKDNDIEVSVRLGAKEFDEFLLEIIQQLIDQGKLSVNEDETEIALVEDVFLDLDSVAEDYRTNKGPTYFYETKYHFLDIIEALDEDEIEEIFSQLEVHNNYKKS